MNFVVSLFFLKCVSIWSAENFIITYVHIHISMMRNSSTPLSHSHLYIYPPPRKHLLKLQKKEEKKIPPSSSSLYNGERFKWYRWMESNRFRFSRFVTLCLLYRTMDNFLFKTRENLSPFRNIHIHTSTHRKRTYDHFTHTCDTEFCVGHSFVSFDFRRMGEDERHLILKRIAHGDDGHLVSLQWDVYSFAYYA